MIVKKKKISETEMALAIINKYHIKKMEGSTNVSYYDGITYKQATKTTLAAYILAENMRGNLGIIYDESKGMHAMRSTEAKEIVEQIFAYVAALNMVRKDNTDWIAVKNGLLNLKTGDFRAHTPEIVTYNLIPHNYNPNAYSGKLNEELEVLAVNDPLKKLLFLEMIGYCMERQPDVGKFFILHGGHANGKSTLLEILQGLLGEENVTGADLRDLCEKRFTLVDICGKLANLGQDIEESYIGQTGILKKIVTGDKVFVEEKGVQGYMYRPYCKLIFSCNTIPTIGKGKDRDAIADRIVIIPMTAHFDRGNGSIKINYGRQIANDENAMEYLLYESVKALKGYFDRGYQFTEPLEVAEAKKEYFNNSDSVYSFCSGITVNEIAHEPYDDFDARHLPFTVNDVMAEYNDFCKINNIKPLGNRSGEVTKRICKYFDLRIKESTIGGRKYRYLVKMYYDDKYLPF